MICSRCRGGILGLGVVHVCLVGSLEPSPPSAVGLISRPETRIVAVEPDESAPRSEGDFAVFRVRQVVQATSSTVFGSELGSGMSLRTVQDEHGRQVIAITVGSVTSA